FRDETQGMETGVRAQSRFGKWKHETSPKGTEKKTGLQESSRSLDSGSIQMHGLSSYQHLNLVSKETVIVVLFIPYQ
ncbi:hypothetical protein STEG23_006717, partial [Scotinomys teguina]